MKIRVWFALSVALLVLCAVGVPAHAQDSKISLFGGYSYGTNNFSCSDGSDFGCEDPGHHGYAVSAAYNLNNHIGLEANFTGHNGTSTIFNDAPVSDENGEIGVLSQDIYTYTFGPRLTQNVGNFTLFTHFLVGGTHIHQSGSERCILATGSDGCSSGSYARGSANGMAFKTGGGVDWNHGRWGIRILEVDYVHTQAYGSETNGSNETGAGSFSGNAFELATGITFNIGKQ